MPPSEIRGRVTLVTGVSGRAGIGAAVAKELALAGAKLFVSFYRPYDAARPWGFEPDEPEALLGELGTFFLERTSETSIPFGIQDGVSLAPRT